MPQISVIVPVYKVELYLHRCVDSILAQTFSDFELILVDDGSPDNCGVICDEYAAKDSRVHVIHQENGGLSAARNQGVKWIFENSDCQWVTFIDSDDWVHEEYLRILYESCINNNAKLSFCHVVEVPEYKEGQVTAPLQVECQAYNVDEQRLQSVFYGENTFGGIACGKLIDISILMRNPFILQRIYEDSPVTCKWVCEAGSIAEISIPLYFYFINPKGISKTFSLKMLDILWAKTEQEMYYRELGYMKMCAVVASSYLVSASRCYRSLIDELDDRKTARRVRMEMVHKYWKYKNKISLSDVQKSYVIRNMHPHMEEAYWIAKICLKKARRMIGIRE